MTNLHKRPWDHLRYWSKSSNTILKGDNQRNISKNNWFYLAHVFEQKDFQNISTFDQSDALASIL